MVFAGTNSAVTVDHFQAMVDFLTAGVLRRVTFSKNCSSTRRGFDLLLNRQYLVLLDAYIRCIFLPSSIFAGQTAASKERSGAFVRMISLHGLDHCAAAHIAAQPRVFVNVFALRKNGTVK